MDRSLLHYDDWRIRTWWYPFWASFIPARLTLLAKDPPVAPHGGINVWSDQRQSSYPNWMIYPLCYSIFLIISGFMYHNYIYSFQNVEQLGWTRVLIYGFGQLLFLAFLGFIYVLLNRRLPGHISKRREQWKNFAWFYIWLWFYSFPPVDLSSTLSCWSETNWLLFDFTCMPSKQLPASIPFHEGTRKPCGRAKPISSAILFLSLRRFLTNFWQTLNKFLTTNSIPLFY